MNLIASKRPRRRAVLALAVAVVGVLFFAAQPAVADVFTPESDSGSPNAERIDALYQITLYVALLVFVGVEGLLIYTLVRHRYRRGGEKPAQIRGNTPLEIGWTVGAALILVVLSVLTFVYLPGIKNPEASEAGGLETAEGVQFASVDQAEPAGGDALEIDVNAQQYLFRYDYPEPALPEGEGPAEGQVFSFHELVVPVDTTVVLNLTSSDVVHAWWVPDLGGKVDAVPGHVNQTWFKASEPGVFRGQCAELCGANHADMRTKVRVVPVAEYEAWIEEQAREIAEGQRKLAVQRRLREAQGQ